MVVEITGDDAVLQHAAEGEAVTARRPGQVLLTTKFAPSSMAAPSTNATTIAPSPPRGTSLALSQDKRSSRRAEREQHRIGRAMGRDREGNEDDERQALARRDAIAVPDQRMKAEHGETGENVGQQFARQAKAAPSSARAPP